MRSSKTFQGAYRRPKGRKCPVKGLLEGFCRGIRRALIPCGPFELQPSLDVACCRDEKVLELRFGQSAITSATHAVGSGQLADGALDAVALMHSFFKRLALLLDSTRLQ
jgi:hypothetical protein